MYRPRLTVAAEERPALTCPVRAGSCELRLGRKKACGAVEQKKWSEGRKVMKGKRKKACLSSSD
jgi:hypothetical protein